MVIFKIVWLLSLLIMLPVSAVAETANMVFVLDASGSMWGQIGGKTKIAVAKEVLNDLIDGLSKDMRVGLFAYGHRSKTECSDIEMLVPVGPVDGQALKTKIAAIQPKGKTPLIAAVQQAAKAMRYTETRATVILVSDGLETCNADPCKVAAELAMSGADFTCVVGFDISNQDQVGCVVWPIKPADCFWRPVMPRTEGGPDQNGG
jgi:Ca-activated chloride channel family protein